MTGLKVTKVAEHFYIETRFGDGWSTTRCGAFNTYEEAAATAASSSHPADLRIVRARLDVVTAKGEP
jgi:hypothetical protein